MEMGLISSLSGAQLGAFQLAEAARFDQMKNGDGAASAAQLIAAAAQNFISVNNVPPGIGSNLDIIA
jgi:hypothetical protein